jgi:ADP-heptose:LPS heptosyltransferase
MPESERIEARRWIGPSPPERILAVRLQALGDTVLTLPYLQAVRRLLPNATLDFLTREEVADIPRSLVLFDDVFAIGGGRSTRRQLASAALLLPRLLARRYQVVLDLQRNRISRFVRKVLGPPAWTEFDRFSARLAGERTRRTIEAVGLGLLDVRPDLTPRRPEAGQGQLRAAGWDGESELVVLNPAGSFPGRSWPIEAYVRFARLWMEQSPRSTQFVVLGRPDLAAKAEYIEDRLAGHLVNLVGRTAAAEAFCLLGRATLVLSEDSGLMHMAWVAGAPTLGIFGASRRAWARPHGNYCDDLGVCRRADGACLDGACLEGRPTCLDRLRVDDVVERARRLAHDVVGRDKTI